MLNSGKGVSPATIWHSFCCSPYPTEGVEVVYTVDPVEAEAWLRNNIIDCSAEAVGFDIEWKPQVVSKKNGGVENKTAVLQLGVESSCLLLHLHNMMVPPDLLRFILNDNNIIKVGSGILQDCRKLKRDTGMICKGMLDTQTVAKSMGAKASEKLGLKALAKRFLGMDMEKPKSITRSNWENYPLTTRQIHYAALDAWIVFKLYQQMKLMNDEDQTHIDVDTHIVDEVDLNPVKIATCHVCKKKCKGKDALAGHMKKHPQCKCGEFFQAQISKKHMKNCPELNLASFKPLDAKVDKNPVEITTCHVCKKKCKRKDALAIHIKIHPQCLCGQFFQAEISKKHRKNCPELNAVTLEHADDKVGENAVEIVTCHVCNKECLGEDFFARHVKIHPQCKCGTFFRVKVSKNHRKNCAKFNPASLKRGDKVNKNPVKIATCHVCKKKCKGKDALASHMKKHPQCKCGEFFQVQISKKHRKNCPELNAVTLDHPVDDKFVENL